MNEELRVIDQTVIQYIRESDAGVSSYSKPLPRTPIYLAPDKPFSGRFHASDGTMLLDRAPAENEREDYIWSECMPTTASREIPRRSRRSFRIRSLDFEANREVGAESMLEESFRLIKRAENRLNVIWDQPPERRYRLPDGSERGHTFDYLIEEAIGNKYAYALRPTWDIDEDLKEAIQLIREQSLDGFADQAFIVTERFVTKSRVRNAIEILDARESRNAADVLAASALVSGLHGAAMLDTLVEELGMGPRGRTAIICLIDDGVLKLVRNERMTPATLLCRVEQHIASN